MKRATMSVLVPVFLLTGGAGAGDVYTDRAAFEMAAPPSLVEGFDDLFANDNLPFFGANVGPTTSDSLLPIQVDATDGANVNYIGPDFHQGDSTAMMTRRPSLDGTGFAELTTTRSATSFGLDLVVTTLDPSTATYTLEFLREGSLIETHTNIPTGSFFGVVLDERFDTVLIRAFKADGEAAMECFDTLTLGGFCVADLNNDGALDFFDVSALITQQIDFNGDTAFDFFDISGFLSVYSMGCP
jgi:hypothetical protein